VVDGCPPRVPITAEEIQSSWTDAGPAKAASPPAAMKQTPSRFFRACTKA